ncbi:alpha/beta hydrolase [Paenibacillus thiaminolyticus]|uniref:Alpha/beta hydrolase n=1 Tax=Paenibacillus thiaminolyticus TaxID=49283 RepID=A0AAP9DZD2_PANTH|nr:alpha/beta hydrolase [Paenibacillus thiaminolyticus]MCY9535096.1 alpha/beta hydrolase [Paenibacillus thiaminolyticus]MCY9600429.1 alpha/beta hydrolase [Paenibacillus thiaminolyticus]MCY9606452.1 alpha/beta hydrolase [Paenibacillus thiaminolyticus]MCY9616077.1 alpha/beta hydrolase [Paenibacillus thiaminolyticus]MCY9622339.1 alpha/beta hydrolase [Paenibacillus thiaminolyticus]
MRHLYEKGTDESAPTLVLLHGTGGSERDLVPLARMISPGSAVLSLRGNVLENGMPRFFRRLAEGIFDEEDLLFRTGEVNTFLDQAAEQYGFDRRNLVAVGYSNGANIAASLLFHIQEAWAGAILHHPMVPRRGVVLPELSGLPVFIGAGKNDPICSPQETEELEGLLRGAGADVTVHWERYGHQLTSSEAEAAADWFRDKFLP